MSPAPRLSAALAVENEADVLEACLASLTFCDEIVVVDGGSTDGTIAVAEHAGARVLRHDSSDGGIHANKNRAIDACAGPWILSIDADERVPRALADEIREKIHLSDAAGASGARAFTVKRKTYWGDHWVRSCGWWPGETIRVFAKGATRWPLEVHRTPAYVGPTGAIRNALEHRSVSDWGDWLRKVRHFSGCEAVEMHRAGRRVRFYRDVVLAPPVVFLRKYIGQSGWKDGRVGLYVSVSAALAVFFKYARLAEIEAGGAEPNLGGRGGR